LVLLPGLYKVTQYIATNICRLVLKVFPTQRSISHSWLFVAAIQLPKPDAPPPLLLAERLPLRVERRGVELDDEPAVARRHLVGGRRRRELDHPKLPVDAPARVRLVQRRRLPRRGVSD
jgi:hypothetical protein